MMKKILSLIIIGLIGCLQGVYAQKKILDDAAAKLKRDKGIVIDYAISTKGNGTTKGTLSCQGRRFHAVSSELSMWYDGKTMWSLNKTNNEVYVTEPSDAELSKVNPYCFLDIYKKGYKISEGKSTGTYNEVILTATNKKTDIQGATVRINKSNKTPRNIEITTKNKTIISITVTSYKGGQKFADSSFRFDKAKYPKVEVVDLR